jgi:hypothetical protein
MLKPGLPVHGGVETLNVKIKSKSRHKQLSDVSRWSNLMEMVSVMSAARKQKRSQFFRAHTNITQVATY